MFLILQSPQARKSRRSQLIELVENLLRQVELYRCEHFHLYLSSFVLGSSLALEVAVAAPKQIVSSLRGEEMAEAD